MNRENIFIGNNCRPVLTWGSSVQDGECVDPNSGGVEEGQRSQAVRDRVVLRSKHTDGFLVQFLMMIKELKPVLEW